MAKEETSERILRRWKAGALVLGLAMVAASGGADAQSVTALLNSGLHTFPQRHTARVTVADTGVSRTTSRVTIELRNARDQVLASTVGILRPGEPVQLELPISDVLTQLRATVSIVSFSAGARPATTFEDVDVDSLTVIPKVFCSGPGSGRDSPQAYCPGWDVTSVVQ
jgi:hypothetical protein